MAAGRIQTQVLALKEMESEITDEKGVNSQEIWTKDEIVSIKSL